MDLQIRCFPCAVATLLLLKKLFPSKNSYFISILTGEPKLCPTSWAKVSVDTFGGTGDP